MFAFHRPKVYRSTAGCCICKAKSSSSRFTDSKKYEQDFLECFRLAKPRQGEICNACVLLVKRWKKLPAGSDRNWRHVVDARAGPGMKSMTKCKSKHKKRLESESEKDKKTRSERDVSPALSDKSDEQEQEQEPEMMDFLEEVNGPTSRSGGSSRTNSPGASDCEDSLVATASSRRKKAQAKRRDALPVSDFVDPTYWKKRKICCGYVFHGLDGELLIDQRYMKPCAARVAHECSLRPAAQKTELPTKTFSDSSSDSGYDESSNHADKDQQAGGSSPSAACTDDSIVRGSGSTVTIDCPRAN